MREREREGGGVQTNNRRKVRFRFVLSQSFHSWLFFCECDPLLFSMYLFKGVLLLVGLEKESVVCLFYIIVDRKNSHCSTFVSLQLKANCARGDGVRQELSNCTTRNFLVQLVFVTCGVPWFKILPRHQQMTFSDFRFYQSFSPGLLILAFRKSIVSFNKQYFATWDVRKNFPKDGTSCRELVAFLFLSSFFSYGECVFLQFFPFLSFFLGHFVKFCELFSNFNFCMLM